MMLSARKDNDHWLDVFTPTASTTRSARPYGLDAFPMLLKSAPPGQYIGNAPGGRVRRRHRDRCAALRLHRPDVARDAARLVRRRVRAHRPTGGGSARVRPRSCAAAASSTTATRTTRRASSPAKRSSRGVSVRIGIMVGPETRRYARQGRPDGRRRQGRGGRGVRDRVGPAAPAGLRRHDRGRAHGPRDEPHRDRHRGGAAAVAPSGRARSAGALGAGGRAAVASASASGRRTTGSSTRCWACPTSSRRRSSRTTSTCSTPCSSGPNPVDVENDRFRIHNPLDVTDLPVPVFLAALGPVMLRLPGSGPPAPCSGWPTSSAIAEHVVPKITKAAEAAGRPAPRVVAGVAVCLCASERGGRRDRARQRRPRACRVLAELPAPARAGRVRRRRRHVGHRHRSRHRAAAALLRRRRARPTSRSRILPLGSSKDEIVASSRRTREFLASLAPEFT